MPKTIFTGANLEVVQIIKAGRLKAGLTQAELAARVGKDQSWLSLIERSQRRLDIVEFIALANAMDIKPERLFSELLAQLEKL